MTDYVATWTGDLVEVKISDGWEIAHRDGSELAFISRPSYRFTTEPINAPKPATVESLTAALVEHVRNLRNHRDGVR